MSETPGGVAKGHIKDLEDALKEGEFKGPEWDMHRQLLRAAHNTTNGGAGDIRVLSENLGMLTATYVQDRIRQGECIKKAFLDLHGNICPVVPLIEKDENGKPVMPWETKKRDAWFGSFLSLEVGSKRAKAGGAVAVVLAVGIVMLCFRWLGMSVSSGIVKTVNSAIKAQVIEQLSALSDNEETK